MQFPCEEQEAAFFYYIGMMPLMRPAAENPVHQDPFVLYFWVLLGYNRNT